MKENLIQKRIETRNKLLALIDRTIQQGHWDSSLFYRNILKKLEAMRLHVVTTLGDQEEQENNNKVAVSKELTGYTRVYIMLYQMKGDCLESWANAVRTLPSYCVTRPIYQHEEHVQEIMRSKRGRSDAYVSLWVRKEDVVSDQVFSQDRYGHALINIREGSIKLENIIEFVHDGNHYEFIENQLVQKSGIGNAG